MIKKYLIFSAFLIISTAKLATLAIAASFSDENPSDNVSLRADVVNTDVNTTEFRERRNNPVKTIVIDPGHGGRDPGGLGKFTKEKDVVLGISLILNDLLNRYFPDVNVILTRDKDVFVPLHERARIANENKANLFISVHCNIAPNRPNVRGTETFVLGLHRAQENLEVAKRENAVIAMEDDHEMHYDGYDPNSPEAHIIFSAYQNAYLGHSIRFASLVEQEFQSTARRQSRGVKQAGFLVLRQATMPSVLVEAGFLSNREEEKFLASVEGQREIALSILRAIQQYLRDWGYEPVASKANVQKTASPAADNGSENAPQNEEVDRLIEVDRPLSFDDKDEFFSIQLLTSSNEIDHSHFEVIAGQEFFTIFEGGVWRLVNGRFPNYETAAKHREKLNELGYVDAFIIGIRDMKRIPVSKLLTAD